MKRHLLLSIGLSIIISGCATATRGTHEVVKINSEPTGARVISDIPNKTKKNNFEGYYGCEPTPCGINISRRAAPVLKIEKEGYESIKFKIVSSNATSATSVKTGAVVAGTQEGSHVVAGDPEFLKRIPVGGAIIFGGLMSLGGGLVLDAATGAGRSLSPNPVTVFLAPTSPQNTPIKQEGNP